MSVIQTLEKENTKNQQHAQQHALSNLLRAVQCKIIGQHQLIEHMLVCLLADGHVLIEGMPGLAKTRSAKAIADGIEGDFHRIQFTPDLLPSDLIGTEIYIHEKSDFIFRIKDASGEVLFTETQNVVVYNGMISALVGSQTSGGIPLESLAPDGDRILEFQMESKPDFCWL